MRRKRRFFLEPRDSHTNEVFAKTLNPDEFGGRPAEHGKTVKVYECTTGQRNYILNSKDHGALQFTVWSSFDNDKIKRWSVHSDVKKYAIAEVGAFLREHRKLARKPT